MKSQIRKVVEVSITAGKLLEFKDVREVHVISGQYELMVLAAINLQDRSIFASVQEESRKLVRDIRELDGIRDTNTIIPFVTFLKE